MRWWCSPWRKGLRFSVHYFRRELAMMHEELPNAVRDAGVTVLLVDQLSAAGSTVADVLGLPFVTIANALLVNREPTVPPYFTGWFPGHSLWARWRNQLGNACSTDARHRFGVICSISASALG